MSWKKKKNLFLFLLCLSFYRFCPLLFCSLSLSRLHKPPLQSNWFKSTSWGGYSVGVCIFSFFLFCMCTFPSVCKIPTLGEESSTLICNSTRGNSAAVLSITTRACNAKKGVRNVSVCALMRGAKLLGLLERLRRLEDWHGGEEQEEEKDMRDEIHTRLPGICFTVVLSSHYILKQLPSCHPEKCKDGG